MKRLRAILLRVCVFLLLGAIVNVVVAWLFFVWRPGLVRHASLDTSRSNQIWSRFDAPVASEGRQPSVENFRFNSFFYQAHAKDFSGSRHREIVECAAGWPLKCLVGQIWEDEKALWLLNLPRLSSLGAHEVDHISSWLNALPCYPLLGAFLLNTAIYAAILWLAVTLPGVLRRRSRIKRGLCPNCRYDLRGGMRVCPECGTQEPIADNSS